MGLGEQGMGLGEQGMGKAKVVTGPETVPAFAGQAIKAR
jgi:hypothetical protein